MAASAASITGCTASYQSVELQSWEQNKLTLSWRRGVSSREDGVDRTALSLELLEDGLDLFTHFGVCINGGLQVFEDLGVHERVRDWIGHGG